jgi:hypothetical protein
MSARTYHYLPSSDHAAWELECRRQEVETLRAELDERDARITELELELGVAKQVLLGYATVTTSQQKNAAEHVAGVFMDVLRRRATQDDAA